MVSGPARYVSRRIDDVPVVICWGFSSSRSRRSRNWPDASDSAAIKESTVRGSRRPSVRGRRPRPAVYAASDGTRRPRALKRTRPGDRLGRAPGSRTISAFHGISGYELAGRAFVRPRKWSRGDRGSQRQRALGAMIVPITGSEVASGRRRVGKVIVIAYGSRVSNPEHRQTSRRRAPASCIPRSPWESRR